MYQSWGSTVLPDHLTPVPLPPAFEVNPFFAGPTFAQWGSVSDPWAPVMWPSYPPSVAHAPPMFQAPPSMVLPSPIPLSNAPPMWFPPTFSIPHTFLPYQHHLTAAAAEEVVEEKPFAEFVKGLVGAFVLLAIFGLLLTLVMVAPWNQWKRIWRLPVLFVDNDGGHVPSDFLAFLEGPIPFLGNFGFKPVKGLTFKEASRMVDEGDYWACIFFPPGFTADFEAALRGEKQFTRKLSYIYDGGRSHVTERATTPYFKDLVEIYEDITRNVRAYNPQPGDVPFSVWHRLALQQPLPQDYRDLHPIKKVGENSSSTLILVLFWVIAMAIVQVVKVQFRDLAAQHTHKNVKAAVSAVRILWATCFLFILSLLMTLVLWGFGLRPARGGFCGIWMWYWFTMLTFCALISVITSAFGPFGNLLNAMLMVIQIVAVVSWELPLFPNFFRLAYGLPMYWAMRGARTIITNSYDRLAIAIGVLMTWLMFSYLLVGVITGFSTKWNAFLAKLPGAQTNSAVGNSAEAIAASFVGAG
eukprot:NODE_314_length_1809_cov_241.721591_g253_i0.p1 GENE.NODE_314_length_1809_cov_241.721591_g253_i0~~NODE_314_length_1809_cov_241.721591_g253_i0.p1  ORF type:complete len:526 (-),score=71.32 NODE_314_length_1809_cov_241.721591_g253_i0:91-1668(-)